MGLFRRKKREEKPQAHPTFAKLMNVAIVLFVIYMLFNSMGQKLNPDTKEPAHSETESTDAPAIPPTTPVLDANGNALLRLRYVEAAQLGMLDILRTAGSRKPVSKLEPGDGPELACGQKLTYRLQMLTYPDFKPDQAFTHLTGKKETGILGDLSNERSALLQLMATGINVGGQSEYVFPRRAMLMILAKGTPIHSEDTGGIIARLNILNAAPAAPTTTLPATILETQFGDARRIRCGANGRFRIRSWYLDGKPAPLLLSTEKNATKPVNQVEMDARLGNGQLPYGIERAAESMGIGGVRLAVIPAEFAAPFPAPSATDPQLVMDTAHIQLVEIARIETLDAQKTLATDPEKTKPAPAEAEVDKSPASANDATDTKPESAPSTDGTEPATAEPNSTQPNQ